MMQALPMVYLVRHGETAWTLTAQHTGRTDLPLNGQGERQVREVAARLTALRIDRIVSSPLQLATGSLSVLGYDHDLAEPVIHAWNGRPEVMAFP